MNTQQIINRARRQTGTSSDDYSDTIAIEDLNFKYEELVDNIIIISKGDYFWDVGTTDTVVNQSEYEAKKLGITPDDLDIRKINKVFMKYDSSEEYRRVKYQNPGVLEDHPDYYKKNQPESLAFFYIQDESIFIYPAPTEAVTGGLQIFVIHSPAELTITSTEDDIEIPKQFHNVLNYGIQEDIYISQSRFNEAQYARQKFEQGITDMVTFMKQRYNQPIKKQIIVPNKYK